MADSALGVTLHALDADEWDYLSEGSVHLVLKHREPGRTIVLRLRKAARAGRVDAVPSDAYARAVLAPLVGMQYVHTGRPVALTRAFVQAVSSRLLQARAQSGVRADPLDLEADTGWMERDHTRLQHAPTMRTECAQSQPTVCFELKPKAALLRPPSTDGSSQWPAHVCHFCGLQLAKWRAAGAQSGAAHPPAHERSAFCPLDLFSGERARVRVALERLVRTPHNNLAVFVDGVHVYGKGEHDPSRLLHALGAARSGSARRGAGAHASRAAALQPYLRAVEEILLHEPLLPRLRAAQAAADPHGTASAASALTELARRVGCAGAGSLGAPSDAELAAAQAAVHAHVRALCAPHARAARASGEGSAGPKSTPAALEPASAALAGRVHGFLLALTLRDCSVMIPMRRLSSGGGDGGVQGPLGARKTACGCEYDVALVDLDQKPASKVYKHVAEEARIGTALRDHLRAGPPGAAVQGDALESWWPQCHI